MKRPTLKLKKGKQGGMKNVAEANDGKKTFKKLLKEVAPTKK